MFAARGDRTISGLFNPLFACHHQNNEPIKWVPGNPKKVALTVVTTPKRRVFRGARNVNAWHRTVRMVSGSVDNIGSARSSTNGTRAHGQVTGRMCTESVTTSPWKAAHSTCSHVGDRARRLGETVASIHPGAIQSVNSTGKSPSEQSQVEMLERARQ